MKNYPREEILANGLDAFLARTGVRAKIDPIEPDLVLLKYVQADCDMSDPAVTQCRGMVLDRSDDWAVVCWPFNKFWNLGESRAAALDWDGVQIHEKLDGSLCTMYWWRGIWRVSTTGNPLGSGSTDTAGITFSDAFWDQWYGSGLDEQGPELIGPTHKCYMFELMTPHNKIVVRNVPGIRLIGIRDLRTGDESDVMATTHWPVAPRFDGSLDDAIVANTAASGMDTEGFVVTDSAFRRVKIKAADYVRLHRLKGKCTPTALLQAVLEHDSDEIVVAFPEKAAEIAGLKARVDAWTRWVGELVVMHQAIESQKDFAAAVAGYPCRGALFAIRSGKAADPLAWLRTIPSSKLVPALDAMASE